MNGPFDNDTRAFFVWLTLRSARSNQRRLQRLSKKAESDGDISSAGRLTKAANDCLMQMLTIVERCDAAIETERLMEQLGPVVDAWRAAKQQAAKQQGVQ